MSELERWEPDADDKPLTAWPGEQGLAWKDCSARPIAGYHYAEAPEFWLGSQDAIAVEVEGAGYLVSRAAGARAADRFSTEAQVRVAPDGSLEDQWGDRLLGYAAQSPCLVPLRAPALSAPQPTTRLSIVMNIDAQAQVGPFTFDRLDASGTSAVSLSAEVVDSIGASHWVDLYLVKLDNGFHVYHVLVDGSDLDGGTPGVPEEVGQGALEFTSDGALAVDTTPAFCASFAGGATAEQCIEVDFGQSIAEGGTGSSGSTQFASSSVVYAADVDGYPPGTGSDISIGASGLITVNYDNGDSLPVGTLALARFARERKLRVEAGGTFRATSESGRPQLAPPLSPGRGILLVR